MKKYCTVQQSLMCLCVYVCILLFVILSDEMERKRRAVFSYPMRNHMNYQYFLTDDDYDDAENSGKM